MRIGKSLLIGILSAVGLASSHATAAVIVLDNFTNTGGAGARPIGTLLELTPPADVNLPGNNWIEGWGNGNRNPDLQTFAGEGTARLSSDVGLGTSIASFGAYVKPTQMSLSARFDVSNVDGSSSHNGAGLGFYNVIDNSAFGFTNFRGLSVNPDSGALNLLNNTTLNNTTLDSTFVQSLAYSGTWNPAVYHTLSYDVNTTGGTLSNVVLDGTSYSFNATNIFTVTNTAYFGIYTSAQFDGQLGYFDFAQLSGVIPEPTSLAVLALGGLGLIARRRRA